MVVVVVAVPADAGEGVRGGPALRPQVVVVGGGRRRRVLVGVVVERLRGGGLQAQFVVGRAGPAAAQGQEAAAATRQRGAEHPGEELLVRGLGRQRRPPRCLPLRLPAALGGICGGTSVTGGGRARGRGGECGVRGGARGWLTSGAEPAGWHSPWAAAIVQRQTQNSLHFAGPERLEGPGLSLRNGTGAGGRGAAGPACGSRRAAGGPEALPRRVRRAVGGGACGLAASLPGSPNLLPKVERDPKGQCF